MIKISLGNLGSGKTLSEIKDLVLDKSGRKTYTNIETKGIKNTILINPENVIKKIENEKGKISFDLNLDFWEKQKKPLNILWDEVHLTANARTSMSRINIIISRFISMGRRITGFDKRGYGHLIFIAQSDRTIDINIRELASQINYNIAHWVIKCNNCNSKLNRNSEQEQIETCLRCGSWNIERIGLMVETYYFNSWLNYFYFRTASIGKYHYKHRYFNNLEKYYKYYNTMQLRNVWENYISE